MYCLLLYLTTDKKQALQHSYRHATLNVTESGMNSLPAENKLHENKRLFCQP